MVSLDEELRGDSEPVRRLRGEVESAAQTLLPVLVLGESGSGKH